MWLWPWWPGINESPIRDGQGLLSCESNPRSRGSARGRRQTGRIDVTITTQHYTPGKVHFPPRHQDHQPAGPDLSSALSLNTPTSSQLQACTPACATLTGPQTLAQLRPR